jgi:cell division septation protein DedD
MLALGGTIAAVLAVVGALVWGITRANGPRSVPLIEADPRPIKVRPDDPGGLRVPNQDELIFERNRGSNAQPGAARLAPEPEGPRIDALRAQVAQPSPPPAAAVPPAPQAAGRQGTAPPAMVPQPAAPQAATPQAAAPPGAAQPATPAARPAPAPGGTIRVQLGALASEEAARAEWDRLARRHAELLGAFRPQVVRFEREGQAPLFRLRTGGFANAEAARDFCEQARGRSIPCTVVR